MRASPRIPSRTGDKQEQRGAEVATPCADDADVEAPSYGRGVGAAAAEEPCGPAPVEEKKEEEEQYELAPFSKPATTRHAFATPPRVTLRKV
jgi:hypothetical protein